MSSLRVLIRCGLSSSALKRRLVRTSGIPNAVVPSHSSSNRFLHSHSQHIPGQFTGTQLNGYFSQGRTLHDKSMNRSEGRVDETLHRLDFEIRRIGRIRRQEVDDILMDIKEMKKATSSQSLMIIRCCGELIPEEPPSSRTSLVQQVWKTLEDLKVPMDVSHYNALLRVYLENEHKFNPTEFLQDLETKGIEPNRVTYQRLIARFCQDGDIDGASTILQHMKEKQMPINEYVFNSLVLGHGAANDMESAEGILTVMKQAGLEPNDDTYVTLMTCYAKQGDISNIRRIVKECEEKEIFLIDRDFLHIIYSLVESGNQQLVDEILPFLRKHNGFNQEATNLVFRLVNIGQEESAVKILKQMTPVMRQDQQAPSGNFFIKHLVHLSRPSDVIIKYTRMLHDEGLNEIALQRACEAALMSHKFDLALDLFEALQEMGVQIRPHFFWPLFASSTSETEIFATLKSMRDLGVTPNTETLREYVIPNLLGKDKKNFQKSLEKLSLFSGVPLGSIASAAMLHLLNQEELKMAAEFASAHQLRFGNQQLRRNILEAYMKTKDAPAFVKIIGSCSLDATDDSSREYVGFMLMALVEALRSTEQKITMLQPVLKELLAQGFGLSNSGSELLQNCLGEALTPDLANSILQLTSPDLTPKISFASDGGSGRRQGMLEERSTEELEEMLAETTRRNGPTKGIKKSLLYNYCRDRDVEKAEALKAELSKEDFVFTAGLHAMLLDLYAFAGKLDEAKAAYQQINKGLEFVMDDLKILRYSSLLQANGDYEGCVEVLKNTPRNESRKPQGALQQATVWKLLNSVAETSPDKTKEVFEILNERSLTPVNSVTLGPLVKAHLNKDDLTGALAEFERCVEQYRVTPWKQELFTRFIKLEDADRLQKVMDMSTNIHGEVNSMYDLVFAFIDCGKLRQARKILETPGLRARNDKIEMHCQRYCQESRVDELENLIQVTKDLIDVDRNSMYFYLLQAYCKQGDSDKALSVWTLMQEENIQPSAELLIYLADFLQKNNRPVPFVVPERSELYSFESTKSLEESDQGQMKVALPKSISEFRRHIDLNDIDKALQIKQRMETSGPSLSINDQTQLIDRLARAERLNEATRLSDQMFERGTHPGHRTLRFLVSRLASAGDVASVERIGDKLNDTLKRAVMFNGRLCLAYANSGQPELYIENYLKKMIKDSEGVSETEASAGSTAEGDDQEEVGSVPVFGCTTLLVKSEHLLPEFEELANKAQHPTQRRALANVLWGFHMQKRDFARAQEIWDSRLLKEKRILFRGILVTARTDNDADLAVNAATQVLRGEQLLPTAKAVACAFALDVLGSNGRVEEALDLLKESLKTVQLQDYPVASLINLKNLAEADDKKFPYGIPPSSESGRRRSFL